MSAPYIIKWSKFELKAFMNINVAKYVKLLE